MRRSGSTPHLRLLRRDNLGGVLPRRGPVHLLLLTPGTGVRRDEDAVALRAENLEPVMLDIRDEANIAALVKLITDDPGRRRLRPLVDNGGIGANAPVEVLPLAEWCRLFDSNFFGQVAMTQALLPTLIESRGTVVNVSSVGGKIAMASYGPYAATKFALEVVSDSLRREVEPLGVKVVVVEPGAVVTEMAGRLGVTAARMTSGMTAEQRGRYAALIGAVVAQAEAAIAKGLPAKEAGRIIANVVIGKRPRTRYTISREAAIIVLVAKFLSDRRLDSLLFRSLKPCFSK